MRKVMGLMGIAALVLGLLYIAWPVGPDHLYDANLTRLADSDLQGYCAGDAYYKSGGTGSAALADACRTKYSNTRSNKTSINNVVTLFCQAIKDNGWDGTVKLCVGIMQQNQYWPTYDGGLTDQWNKARPYPKVFLAGTGSGTNDPSRTGNRDGNSRSNNPTHDTPTFGG